MGAMIKTESVVLTELARQEAQQYLTFMLGGEASASTTFICTMWRLR